MASSSKKSPAEANLLGKRGPQDDFETKPILRKHKGTSEENETTEGFDDCLQQVEFLGTQSDQPNSISVEETVEGLDESPDFVEDVAVRKKTLYFGNFAPETKISDIIDFFINVEGVVRVQLAVSHICKHRGYGFVEFASCNEAEKALQNKNGEYLHDHKILLDVDFMGAAYVPPKFCIDHKVWAEDYLRPESLPIGEDATFPDFVEDIALREKTLFVTNLSPQTKIREIIDFFNFYGNVVVSVRLIANHEGKHLGYGFVEFSGAQAAKRELEKKYGEYLHDRRIFLDLANTDPYPPRSKYNLAEMLWYEDCLRRESLPIDEEDETPSDFVEDLAIRGKTLYVANLSPQTNLTDIINFFKDVGEVVHFRLIVDHHGKHVGEGFVEFASTKEAKKALEKKNGEYLHDQEIFLDVDKTDPYPPGPKCCIDHKVWYEDYLGRESLLIEEDETVEGLVEEVAGRKKTLFVANLARKTNITHIAKFFKEVGGFFRVRLIVNHMGEHVGCGFVEFESVNKAKKALQKNGQFLFGSMIFLDVCEIEPYPLRPKYNLAEKLWYKDYLQQKGRLIEEDDLETKPNLEKQKEKVMGIFCGKKTIFSNDS